MYQTLTRNIGGRVYIIWFLFYFKQNATTKYISWTNLIAVKTHVKNGKHIWRVWSEQLYTLYLLHRWTCNLMWHKVNNQHWYRYNRQDQNQLSNLFYGNAGWNEYVIVNINTSFRGHRSQCIFCICMPMND